LGGQLKKFQGGGSCAKGFEIQPGFVSTGMEKCLVGFVGLGWCLLGVLELHISDLGSLLRGATGELLVVGVVTVDTAPIV
jgi:hypothetical protein